jgi:pSer/pThr/pTyr-binding forkhead associated (FHA) protein
VVTKDTIRIGTAPDNELVLNDDTVSRLHAEILKTKDGYLIRDLGSTNGTFVGNVRVKEVFLTASSVIRVGKTKIRFTPAR